MAENIGSKFNKLTVLSIVKGSGLKKYECLCDCGKTVIKDAYKVKTGHTKSCGCSRSGARKSIIGNKYGKITVLKELKVHQKDKSIQYECICDCGTIFNVEGHSLKTGNTKSCGCSRLKDMTDIVGNKYGKLTVISLIDEKRNADVIPKYECKCDCGNTVTYPRYSLISNSTKTCGCYDSTDRRGAISDIINNRYGKLTVVEELDIHKKGDHIKYRCVCDCGNEKIVCSGNLKSGNVQSCGCLTSKGERAIINMLIKEKIDFENQKGFNNLINKLTNRCFKFDFFINGEYIVEFDGKQHFSYSDSGWSNKENFEKTRKRDLMKNKYCFDNKITLIRIPYWHLNNLKIEDLLVETSNFILTKDNEEQYYNSNNEA